MAQTYTIQRGDSLSKIAKQFGVTVDALVAANHIANPNLIQPGQVLTIPGVAATPPLPPTPPAPPAPPPSTPKVSLADFVKGPPFPRFNLKDPCAQDPNNLIVNGSMGPGYHDTPYGTVVDGWQVFIMSGDAPNFRHVDNEQIDPFGSQQIYTDKTFDAGVYQTVKNLTPGTFYLIRLGYSLAAKSYDGPNVRVQTIGRKIGVDPYGGTDPKSPNVFWGPDYFDGKAALNIPAMTMIFPALTDQATIFLRAMATDGSGGENRVWLDAVCMEPRPDIPPIDVPKTFAPPPPAPPVTAPQPPAQPTGSVTTYTVQPGDTLFGIARKLGVAVADLTAANNIANPSLIKPGQVLQIPKK